MFWSAPACRSFGLRRSGNLWGRLGGRVPERASSKAVASASTPNLGDEAAVFWSASGLPELWIALERELAGAAERAWSRACVIQSGRKRASASTPNLGGGVAMFWSASGLPELWIASERELVGAAGGACPRARVIQSCRKRQHSKLGWRGGYVSECFRHAGALDRVGTGTRQSGSIDVFPSMRHPKRSRAASASTPNLGGGAAMIWSASGLPELWIASERELVGAARQTCSRARVIQSCRKRQHSKLGWRGGYFWIAPEREHVGAARPACSRACVIQSGRERASASTPNLGGGCLCFGVLPACRSFGFRRNGNSSERLGRRVPEHALPKS